MLRIRSRSGLRVVSGSPATAASAGSARRGRGRGRGRRRRDLGRPLASARSVCSTARSGARPAQSRSRRTSRACEKYSRASTASPRKAAIPTYAPTRSTSSTLLLRERLDVLAGAVLRPVPTDANTSRASSASAWARYASSRRSTSPSTRSKTLLDPLRLERDALGAQDAVRVRGDRPLARAEQLLAQLLAGPRADDLDRYLVRGSWPDSRIMLRARSMIFTCSPISSTKVSPPRAMFAARITSCTASGIVMK